jgi:hypothetical protein
MFPQFWAYFTKLTNGHYNAMMNDLSQALGMADQEFALNNNGIYISQRPDLYENYIGYVQNILRTYNYPVDFEREVGTRLKEFIKLTFNV